MIVVYCIDAPHFCCAVEVDAEMIVRCAPIVSYMQSWSIERCQAYCDSKGWTHYYACSRGRKPKRQKAVAYDQPSFHFVSGRLP